MQFDFTFQQYLGFLAFLLIGGIGFWLMTFLLTYVIPYWLSGAILERIKECRKDQKTEKE